MDAKDKYDMKEKEIITHSSILVEGCKKHSAYRAIRPATGKCAPCVKMWQARQALIALGYDKNDKG